VTEPLGPAYLVRGEDPALVTQALSALLHQLAEGDTAGLGVEDRSAEEPDISAIVDACLTPPFLADRRVILVRDISRLRSDDVDRLVAYLAQPSDTTSLVLSSTGAVPARLAEAVRKAGHVVDASAPTSRNRGAWLAAQLRRAPVRLDGPATALLASHLGEDVGRLEGILSALGAAYGEGAAVDSEGLGPFLGMAGSAAPWDLTDALDRSDAEAALEALHRLLRAGGRHPLVVLASLHRHYSAMLRLDGAGVTSDAEAAEVLGMRSTFPAGKARAQSARLGSGLLVRALGLLADADLDLRGRTVLPDEAVLEVLVARLARLAPAARRVSRSRSR
jgi:DNA polymerase-3 subunit delta